MVQQRRFVQFTSFVIIFVFLFLFTACGDGNSAGTTATTNTDSNAQPAVATEAQGDAVATMPAPSGNFAAVGQQSVLTNTKNLTSTESSAANTANLELGQRIYTKNKCGDCHGAKGEGVEGKGKGIASTTVTLKDFDAVLRTGGGQGNVHIFGRSAVSPTGMEALYAYVQSLK